MKKGIEDEQNWISLLKDGDKVAFSKIYNQHSPTLLHKLNTLLPDEEAVIEIHQMAFVRLWDIREKIRPEQGVWSLLYTIGRNLVVDYYRKSASNESIRKALLTQATLYYELDEPNNILEQMTDALSKAIDRLPVKRKEIFLNCKFQGKSYEEVASMSGVSVGTVKDHMAKAMRFLKAELGDKLFVLLMILMGYIDF